MLKTLGIVAGGVFVGAVGMELLRKKFPGALRKAYVSTRQRASEAREAFKVGYDGALQSGVDSAGA